MAKKSPRHFHKSPFLSTNLLLVVLIGTIISGSIVLKATMKNQVDSQIGVGDVASAETTSLSRTIKGRLYTLKSCEVNARTGTKLCYTIKDSANISYYLQSATFNIESKLQNNDRTNNVRVSGAWVSRGKPEYLVITDIIIPTPSPYPSDYNPPTPPP